MDAGTVGIVLMIASIVMWALDRFIPSQAVKVEVNTETNTASIPFPEIIKSAAGVAMPQLVFIVGFILLTLDQGWISFTASSGTPPAT
jgi:hypothetical protein